MMEGMPPPQRSTLQLLAPWMPAVQLAISVAPRTTSSYSLDEAMAATLDHVEEEKEEISFHEFHAHHM